MRQLKAIFSIAAVLLAAVAAAGKEAADTSAIPAKHMSMARLKYVTDSLIRNYRFSEAALTFEEAKAGADSLTQQKIDEAMVYAQNGENMTAFCSTPETVARERFSLNDFFLFYPLEDNSWRKLPNMLDGDDGKGLVKATYLPFDEDIIFWSAKDDNGIRNIYHSELADTLWTAPELLNEQMTTTSDEIYPMLSPDGKQLFFASKGLYGMGGYDLYVSEWDETAKDWGVPVNLGFPYSSPYDDFLYINTADGKYSMFASNRACSADSVDIYVLEYDSMPVRKAITDPEELRKLCELTPKNDPSILDNGSAVSEEVQGNGEMRRYSDKLLQVRTLRDSIYAYSRSLDAIRNQLQGLSGNEKASLAAQILSRELQLPKLQDSLATATRELQKIELGFLQSGIVIDPEKLRHDADREVKGAASGYTFSKKCIGPDVRLDMLKPEPDFDYSFQILPEGRFAEDNTLPEGLVYQIQLFIISSKATVRQIKGLSPVFERQTPGGKRIYSVGLFHSYKDVLSHLNSVKRLGFRSAIITAFQDGKPVAVSKARVLEKTIQENYIVRIFPEDGKSLGESEISAIQSITSADLAKVVENGTTSYISGPYTDKSLVDNICSELKARGFSNIRTEKAEKE